ncbi:hypothetical protein [Patiriisocius sp. Uisw_047]|jgi:hypothetical protein|uniref:hypothetical protein n=1 Tax=Patiriisocius sp. Uisw_047 TaxID=3230969 RepID=UPI0039EC3A7E
MSTITFNGGASCSSNSTNVLVETDDEGNLNVNCEGPYIETGTYSLDGNTRTIELETTTDLDGEVHMKNIDATAVVTTAAVSVYDRQ